MRDQNIRTVLLDISSGFSFRSRVKDDPDGDLFIIQMKDLDDHYSVVRSGLIKIDSRMIRVKDYLQNGDILFLSKGLHNYAIEYRLNLPKAVASSAFFVLRPDKNRVIPGYLAWYINQPPVQQYLRENMAGTYIPNINKSTVEGIMVSLPPLHIQENIITVDLLRKKEHALMEAIMNKRKDLVSNALLEVAANLG